MLKWLHRRPLGVASQAGSVTSKRFGSRLQSDCRGEKEKESRADNVESFRRGPSSLCQGKWNRRLPREQPPARSL